MKRYKIIVAYDGTDYCGWQVQKDDPTIAGLLQKTFKGVFKQNISILGASRTDAGVHAFGQVATFTTDDLNIEPQTMLQAWSNVLSPECHIRSLELVADDFNPHRNVLNKTYWYHFFTTRPLPHLQRYGYFYRYPVDLKKLHACLEVFIGEHDFRSFCTGDECGDDTIRRINAVNLEYLEQYQAYRISITGPRFLRYMIRRIVGACLEVASRPDLSIEHLTAALAQKNPEQTLPNAPAKGLMLYSIAYNEQP